MYPITGIKSIQHTRECAGAVAAYEYIDKIYKLTNYHANKAGLSEYIGQGTDK